MTKYEETIQTAVKNITIIACKLNSSEGNYLLKQLNILINYLNQITEDKKKLALNNIKSKGEYSDVLEKCYNLITLHGYSEHELMTYLNDEFVIWLHNALKQSTRSTYKHRRISAEILISLAEGYRLYKLANEKQPDTYQELRHFVINQDDIFSEYIKNTLNKYTDEN